MRADRHVPARTEGAAPDLPHGPATGAGLRELVQLLPDLAVTLYEAAPKGCHEKMPTALSGRQMRAVIQLAHRPGMTMGELAEGVGISPAAATELVARLEDKGIVRREHGTDDRRLVLVRLNQTAERLADQLLSTWARNMERALAEFPEIDANTLTRFLRALMQICREEEG